MQSLLFLCILWYGHCNDWNVHIVDISVLDIAVSPVTSMSDGCLFSFTADPNRDTSGLSVGSATGRPLALFPDPGARTCQLRVRHSKTSASYAVEIIGTNLQCRQGIMDVFIQNGCATTSQTGVLFTECRRSEVMAEGNGNISCTYICKPATETGTTSIRISKMKHIAASYENWSLSTVKLIRIWRLPHTWNSTLSLRMLRIDNTL